MRTFENLQYGDEGVIKASLEALTDKTTGVENYRKAFRILGEELGKILAREYKVIPAAQIMLVCASEDADWLATGVELGFGKGELKKSVYWSTREVVHINEDGSMVEISPIEKAYEEPISDCQLLVIVKSIISTSCVVKTQLTRLIGKINPRQIAILAPVMYKDGIPNLMREFPKEINCKFHFVTFAIDDERQGCEVIPGIGGMVYSRLGLVDIGTKNHYIPEMVLRKM
jgi:uracil phosphoribosyltransferase